MPIDFLTKITANKRMEVEELKIVHPLAEIQRHLPDTPGGFRAAISRTVGTNIIAEIKKGSPSKGLLKADFNPIAFARHYQEGGAAAISVLTEQNFFFGRYEYLKLVRETSGLPVLCKDFIFDLYQVYYAKYMHADAILLIVRMLSIESLQQLLRTARSIGLDVLVEVHSAEELTQALACGADIIGVNNRNLETFEVAIETSELLAPLIPGTCVTVAESGLSDRHRLLYLSGLGYNSFLVGESLMTSDDPVAHLRRLRGL